MLLIKCCIVQEKQYGTLIQHGQLYLIRSDVLNDSIAFSNVFRKNAFPTNDKWTPFAV